MNCQICSTPDSKLWKRFIHNFKIYVCSTCISNLQLELKESV